MYQLLKLFLIIFVTTVNLANAEDTIIKKYPDGSIYTGPLKKGLHHGVGVYSLPNGYEYNGEWVEGKIQGKGIVNLPDGSIYKGEFSLGKPSGIGKMVFLDKKI